MNIYEYQAKELLSKNAIKVPKGKIAYTPTEAKKVARQISDKGPWVLKAQIQSGARNSGYFLDSKDSGKGGIRIVEKVKELEIEAAEMLGSTLVTEQTGKKGKFVSRIYVEKYEKVSQTFYIGMAIDRVNAVITLLVASTKNDDVGSIIDYPAEKVLRIPIDLIKGPSRTDMVKVAEFLKIGTKSYAKFYQFVTSIYKTFMDNDCLMVEINPAALLKNGDVLALDAKINLDDNALYRHPENKRLADDYEISQRERKAMKYGFSYSEFDGNIGFIVNGDGITVAMSEMLKEKGCKPACSLNVKGGVEREKIASGVKIITTNPKVEGIVINILSGFMRCDLIADGIIDAAAEVGMNIPLVVRFEGTNRDEAKSILKKANLPIVMADNMEDAVDKIIKSVEESD